LGGGDAAPLVEGYRWAMVELRMPPEISARMVVQMKDQAAAASMQQVYSKGLEMAKTQSARDHIDLTPLVQILAPRVEANRMIVEVKAPQVAQLASVLGPSVVRAREHAKEVASMSQMRQMLVGVAMYLNDNKAKYPEKLEDVVKYVGGPLGFARLTTNPMRPQQQPGYVYVKPKVEAGKPANGQTVILYEAFDKWPGVVHLGYADGHVEGVGDEAAFRRALAGAGQ
jgi:hypothetical protein